MKMQNGLIIRPLLNVKKQDLINYLKKEGIKFRLDSSNFDTKFKRNHLRHIAIPDLKKKWKNLEKDLLILSVFAQKRIVIIEKQAKKWIQKYVKNYEFKRLAFLSLSDDIQSEVLFLLAGRQDVYSTSIKKVKDLIQKGRTGKQKKIRQLTFRIQYDKINFNEISEGGIRPPQAGRLEGSQIRWGNWKLKYKGSDILYVRAWQAGDRFQPAGMKGTKKLQDFFVDQKIPKSNRHKIPIIVDKNNQILSIGNLRFDSRALKMNLKQKLVIEK